MHTCLSIILNKRKSKRNRNTTFFLEDKKSEFETEKHYTIDA